MRQPLAIKRKFRRLNPHFQPVTYRRVFSRLQWLIRQLSLRYRHWQGRVIYRSHQSIGTNDAIFPDMADGRRRVGRPLKQKMDAILVNGYIIRVNSAVGCFSHMRITGPSQRADVKAVKDTPAFIFPGGAPAGDPHQAIHITIGTSAGDRVRPDPVHIRKVQGRIHHLRHVARARAAKVPQQVNVHRRKHVDISRTVHNHRWLIMAHVIVKFRDRPVDVLTHSPR
ncbi:Uncharacterised protein [Klebsiella pneumoniae]|nr:Uncharacterised protein [Klebsiella pneumoniae]SXN50997.1 Uncharacterised protein [Klebsiella pneumoniae]